MSGIKDDTSDRSQRLKKAYTHPLAEVYLMFYHFVLQLFVKFNKFLQSEDPIIPVIWNQSNSFIKKLVGKFVRVDCIRRAASDITTIDYRSENQLTGKNIDIYSDFMFVDQELHIGFLARNALRLLEHEGDVTTHQVKVFYQAVRSFYIQATDYALQNLPLKDEILKNARFANVPQREHAYVSQIEYLYRNILPCCLIHLLIPMKNLKKNSWIIS